VAAILVCAALVQALLDIDSVGQYCYAGASFGVAPGEGGLHGRIIEVTPADGCTPLNITHPNKGDSAWFAKVDRGECDFYTKVLNAQRAGAAACIVANDGPELFRMAAGAADPDNIQIVVILVKHSTGQAIDLALKTLGDGLEAKIMLDILPLEGFFLPCIIIFVITGCMSVVMLWYRRRSRRRANTPASTPATLTPKQLSKIKTEEFSYARHGHGENCTICLEAFVEGAVIRPLPCGHFFHQTCIDTWLLEQAHTCPLCKDDVLKPAQRREPRRGGPCVTESSSLLVSPHETISVDHDTSVSGATTAEDDENEDQPTQSMTV